MKKIFCVIVILLFILSSSMPAFAGTGPDFWEGNTSVNFADSPDNWTVSSTNNPPFSGDSWVFDAAGLSGTTLNNNLTSYSVAGITFNSDASAYTINGNSIALTGAIANNSNNNETLGMGISSGTMTNSGTGSGSTIISGDIGPSVTTVTQGSTTSTLILSGDNTYSGATTVSNGTLNIQSNGALSGSGATVASGATLQIQGSITTSAEPLTLNGTGYSSNEGALENVSGTNTYAGLITLGSAAQINSDSGTLTLSNPGTITGSGDGLTVGGVGNTAIDSIIGTGTGTLTKVGTGTLTLSGDNTYSGATYINGGVLQISAADNLGNASSTNTISMDGGTLDSTSGTNTLVANQAITLAGAGTIQADAGLLTVDGTITNGGNLLTVQGAGNTTLGGNISGSGGLTKAGTGTLILSGDNTYSGVAYINGGVLQISAADNLGNASSTNTISMDGGTLDSTSGTNTLVANQAITLAGAGTIQADAGLLTVDGTITNGGNLLTVQGAGNTTLGGNISGSGGLTKAGAGTVILSGTNAYTGATTVNAGTLEAGAVNQAFGLGSAVSLAVGGTLDLGGFNETIGSLAGAGTVTSSSGSGITLTTGGGAFSGAIEDGSAVSVGLTKEGNGTLTLSGTNTYTGATTVNDGILNIQSNGALSGSSGTTVASGATLQIQGSITTSAEPLTLNGTGYSSNEGALENVSGTNTYAGLITLGSAAQINSDSGTLTLSNPGTITGSGDGLTVGGVGNTAIDSIIGTGTGTLTKVGTGTLTLSGNNTFTGGVNFNGGTVNATALSNLGNGGGLTFAGGTLQFGGLFDPSSLTMTFDSGGATFDTNGININFADAVGNNGTGGLTKTGAGTLTLSGINTYSGGTTVNAGTLTVNAGSTLGATTGPLSVNNTNTGAGTAVLLNLSPSAGGTTTGSLSGTIATPSSGTNTATINNNSELFTVNQTANGSYAGVIEGTGGFTLGNFSSNTLTLSGTNTYSGGTIISAGKLQVENASALGTGPVVNNATLVLGTTNLSLGAGSAYTQSTNSALYLTVDSSSSFGKITSAVAASIAAGSSVNVGVGGYILNSSTFDIINTGGAGVGADPTTITSTSSLVSFSSSIVNGNLVLTADNSGFASLGNNSNARAVGRALDSITNPSGDMANVLNTLEVLSNGGDAKITSALNTMGPIVDRGVIQNSSASLDNLVSATLDRIQNNLDHAASGNPAGTGVSSGDESTINGIWAKPYGSYLTQGTLQGIQGYDAWNAGTVVGYDRMITDDFTLGVSGGYAYGVVNSDANNAITDISSAQGTIYAGYQDPTLNYFIDAAGSFGWNWYNGQRDIVVGSIDRTADADYDGQQYGAFLEGGYKFTLGGNLELTPLASVQWIHLSLDRYTETNADALDLNVDSQSYDTLESGLGASISYPEQYNWGNFTPELHAKWLYDFINDDMSVTSSFTGGGGSFTSNGAAPAKEGANIGGKLSFDLNNDISLIAQFDTELKDQFFGVYGSGTVRYKF